MGCIPDLNTNVHVDDVGTRIVLEYQTFNPATCTASVLNISSATTQEITLQKPSGASTTFATAFDTDGSDGRAVYVTQAGDIDELGTWRAQGRVVLSGGGDFRTEVFVFTVDANL